MKLKYGVKVCIFVSVVIVRISSKHCDNFVSVIIMFTFLRPFLTNICYRRLNACYIDAVYKFKLYLFLTEVNRFTLPFTVSTHFTSFRP